MLNLKVYASLLLAVISIPAAAADPTYIPISQFGTFGPQNASTAGNMTADDVKKFEQAISRMPDLARYLFSGCHDRAHAAYRFLPADLKSKVSKIWVIGPSRFTAAVSGTIRLRATDLDSQQVDWGYHVALVAETPKGTMVYDPALSPGVLLSREQWFESFVSPTLSIWLVSSPLVYQFNYATLDSAARNGSQVWNGNANRYEWMSTQDQRIPQNLARDSIGVDAMKGQACAALVALKADPQGLGDLLDAPTSNPGCAASIQKYRQLTREWQARLAANP